MTPQPKPRPARSRRAYSIVLALALWLLLAVVAGLTLWQLRRDAIAAQARELALLSLASTLSIEQGLRGAEEGLLALRDELKEAEPSMDSQAMPMLRNRADLMPLVRSLWLLDANGQLIGASDATPAPALLSFLPALQQLSVDGTALSRPFGGIRGQDALVAMAIRMSQAPGAAAPGWILAALPIQDLLGAFGGALSEADAHMALFRSDGTRMAGTNLGVATLDDASLFRELDRPPGIEVRSFGDGSQSLVGVRTVPRYGIRVLVSRDLAAALSAWREAAEMTGISLAVLLAVVMVAVHLVRRAEDRHSEAQAASQAQQARASKLESLGTLAGSVAHDFNNVLAGIVGFGEMARDAAPDGSDQARQLDKVLQAAGRGKALVERILAFSRGSARESAVFELEPLVEEVLNLLSASLRPGVVLERALEAPAARVRGDATLAFEAVMNLCVNAMQAMPEGGMLSVHLQRVHIDAPQVLSHTQLSAGDHLALSVSDSGGGITPEVMEHLFEPFFTTRATQSGTGLGLAVVFGIVVEFGGAIDVRSSPGQGARFTLYLPECQDSLKLAPREDAAPPAGGGQRLLVVDDDAGLVAMITEMLRGLGYRPVGYTDPSAALQALRDDPASFAAVITDEIMPQLSGTQLTQELRTFAPRLPVLLVSGYGGAQLAQRAAAAGVTRVLPKPLQRTELARSLAEVLG